MAGRRADAVDATTSRLLSLSRECSRRGDRVVRIGPKSKKRPPIASSDGDESHRWRKASGKSTDAASAQFVMIAQNEEVLDRARLILINNILLA